jgi:HEAT repeat protein
LLASIEAQGPDAISGLLNVLKTDKELEVRCAAARALADLAPKDATLEKALLEAIERGEPYGAMVLFDINPRDPRVPRAYARFLTSPDLNIRCAWLDALYDVRSDIDDFFRRDGIRPPLTKTLKEADPKLLDLRPLLMQAMSDSDSAVKIGAIQALRRVYPHDPNAAPAFARLLKDPDENVRHAAVCALGETESKDPTIVWALISRLRDTGNGIPFLAAYRLNQMQLKLQMHLDPKMQMAIIEVIKEDDPQSDARHVLADIMKDCKTDDPTVLKAIISLLNHKSPDVRIDAVKILGALRSPEPHIQLALVKALTDESKGLVGTPSFEAYGALRASRPLSSEARAALEKIVPANADSEQARDVKALLEQQ